MHYLIHFKDILKKIPINTSMKEFFKSAGLLLGCILLSRFILPANITPIIAMAVFMPYLTSNKQLQMFLPVSMLFVTDIFLGFYSTMWLTYVIMALIGFISRVLNNGQYSTLMGSSVLSVVLWHLIINIPGPFPPLSPEALIFDLRLLGSLRSNETVNAIGEYLKLSKNKSLNIIGNCYTTIIRGVPELLVIYLLFFGGTGAAMYVASIFGYDGYIEINAFITGALAIGIISGAYSTEVFRGAILSIDKGQFEASKVLGIKKYIQFYKIILPQMLRLSIPNLSNVWQITLKDTSLISVTGLVEIMRQSYIAAGSTRDPLFFYSVAAVLYLMLTFLSMKLINKLEIKYSKGY